LVGVQNLKLHLEMVTGFERPHKRFDRIIIVTAFGALLAVS
jgi:hypothetical protein